MSVEINNLAVLLAGASTMVIGAIWYSKAVFGTMWASLAHVNLDRKMKKGEMPWIMGTTLIASLVTAFVLAHVAFLSNQFFGNSFLEDTLMTALWLWLGFTAARIYVHDAFETRRKKLTILSWGYELVTVMVMALIIGAIGV